MNKLLTTTALLLLTATSAFAATTVTGNYSVQYAAGVGNGPTFESSFPSTGSSFTSTLNSVGFTQSLTAGVTTTQTNFFGVRPAGSCGSCDYNYNHSAYDTASGTITVTFSFTGATQASYSDTAAYLANYHNDTDSVNWASTPIVVNFTDGSVLDVNLINAHDWTIYPDISFKLVNGPTPVPEPASLALVGAGLLGLSGIALHRRRKALKKSA